MQVDAHQTINPVTISKKLVIDDSFLPLTYYTQPGSVKSFVDQGVVITASDLDKATLSAEALEKLNNHPVLIIQ